MRRIALLLVVVLGASPALADGEPLTVEVGKTIERDVGVAVGLFCDDVSFATVELKTVDDRNVFVVTGVKEGTTQCRVGTDPSRASYLFELHVVPKKKPAAAPARP